MASAAKNSRWFLGHIQQPYYLPPVHPTPRWGVTGMWCWAVVCVSSAFQVKEFFSELDIQESKQKKHLFESGFKVPRRKSILPPHLHSVMGSANLLLARGDTVGTIELCKEIIRQGE